MHQTMAGSPEQVGRRGRIRQHEEMPNVSGLIQVHYSFVDVLEGRDRGEEDNYANLHGEHGKGAVSVSSKWWTVARNALMQRFGYIDISKSLWRRTQGNLLVHTGKIASIFISRRMAHLSYLKTAWMFA